MMFLEDIDISALLCSDAKRASRVSVIARHVLSVIGAEQGKDEGTDSRCVVDQLGDRCRRG